MQPNYSETPAQLAALQAFAAGDNLAELQRLAARGETAKRQSLRDFAASDNLAELQRLAARGETAKRQSLHDFAASDNLVELELLAAEAGTAKFHSLRDFADSAGLHRLQELLTEAKALTPEFNLFELLNLWWQEDIHSRMLTWLLNPQESHGLGDHFLKNFLLQAGCPSELCSSIDWSKSEALREWHCVVDGDAGRLDILILDQRAQFLCAIENKIFSPEGGRQLTHYRKALENGYRNYTRRYLFLSPGGMQSQWEDERQHWTPVSYTAVLQVIDQMLETACTPITPEVRVLLSQYATTLRSKIVPDHNSEIHRLARQIYLEHREAVDLIYANKPNYTNEAKQIFKEAIAIQEGWLLDREDSYFLRFHPAQWNEFPATRTGTGWLPDSPALLLFQINFRDGRSNLPFLDLGLSPGSEPLLREKLFEKVRQHPQLFHPRQVSLQTGWMVLDAKEYILDEADFGKWDTSVPGKIAQWVADFAGNEFPAMNEVILNCLREHAAATGNIPRQGQ